MILISSSVTLVPSQGTNQGDTFYCSKITSPHHGHLLPSPRHPVPRAVHLANQNTLARQVQLKSEIVKTDFLN